MALPAAEAFRVNSVSGSIRKRHFCVFVAFIVFRFFFLVHVLTLLLGVSVFSKLSEGSRISCSIQTPPRMQEEAGVTGGRWKTDEMLRDQNQQEEAEKGG